MVPLALQSRLHADGLEVDLQIGGITPEQCARIANQLRSMPVVTGVVTGEKV